MQETAVRETYRIVGEVTITRQDYTTGRVFDDAIAYGGYPIDIHRLGGGRLERLPKGIAPTIPLRALVPKGSRNLMVAGRSISSDRAASSGLRVQATCMAMGQAAGAAAALRPNQGSLRWRSHSTRSRCCSASTMPSCPVKARNPRDPIPGMEQGQSYRHRFRRRWGRYRPAIK
jgi:hypothetical protein